MWRVFPRFLCLILCLAGLTAAQGPVLMAAGSAADKAATVSPWADGVLSFSADLPAADHTPLPLVAPVVLPRMAPELALQAYRGRSVLQAANLASYSATTVIHAQLPDSSQSGEYELQTRYSSPRALTFKALRFTGDAFVKTNVIVRLLQSEVDHLQKDDPALTAITPANYKFSYKGTNQMQGRLVHVYQLKPRKKRAGLFKGRIYLDAYSGSMVRAEGRLVKPPSFFVKKIEFVQDFADIDAFTFPVHIHSEAQTRLVGRAVVDIYDADYQPVAATAATSQRSPTI